MSLAMLLKSVREREQVLAGLLASVAEAEVAADPVPHAILAAPMPADVHARCGAFLPDAAHFEPVTPPRRLRRAAGQRSHRFELRAPDLQTLPADVQGFWTNIGAMMADARVAAALEALLAAPGRRSRDRAGAPDARETTVRLERAGAGGRIPLLSGGRGGDAMALVAVLPQAGGPGLVSAALAAPRRGVAAIAGPRRRPPFVLGENEALAVILPGGDGTPFPGVVLTDGAERAEEAVHVLTVLWRAPAGPGSS